MPELPDVVVYAEHLERRLKGRTLRKVRLASPFVLRSVAPPVSSIEGCAVRGVSRLGKRLVFLFEGEEGDRDAPAAGELFLVMHLMIAGRLQWKAGSGPALIPKKIGLLSLDFDSGSLLLREASPKKRAWVRVVAGREALLALDPGGLEPLEASRDAFVARLRSENHTLKRALTDPTLFSGIGNAYSDEILHAARLSPVALTSRLADEEADRLFDATRTSLLDWTERLRRDAGDAFPEKVTAFREDMAVHGKFGKPCPRCGTSVQRIVYAANETNYCPACQTGGKLLADRSLSRLLRGDWPKSLEEMEERIARSRS
jgi:formamidopyrimidine-DNA glycosylase